MSRRLIVPGLPRRILGMLTTLFRRRWAAAGGCARRSRLGRRLRAVADGISEALAGSTKLVNTHLLTLAQPEFLERRAVMDVGAGMNGTTLGIWIDDSNSWSGNTSPDYSAYMRQNPDGTISVATDPSFNFASVRRVEGQNQTTSWSGVTNIAVFRAASISSYTVTSPGSGYTTAPTVSITGATFATFTNSQATASTTISLTNATVTGGANLAQNGGGNGSFPITLIGGSFAANTTAVNAVLTIGVVNGTFANRTFTSGSNYSSLSGLTLDTTDPDYINMTSVMNVNMPVSLPSVSGLTGGLERVIAGNGGFGYFQQPTITFSGTGGAAASATFPFNTSNITSFTVAASTSNLTAGLNIGYLNAAPTYINLSGIGNSLAIGNASLDISGNGVTPSQSTFPFNVTFSGNISTTAPISVNANDAITLLSPVNSGDMTLNTESTRGLGNGTAGTTLITNLTNVNVSLLRTGMLIAGTNIPSGTTIAAINVTNANITLSQQLTGAVTANRVLRFNSPDAITVQGGTVRPGRLAATAQRGNITFSSAVNVASSTNAAGPLDVLALAGGITFSSTVNASRITAHAFENVTVGATMTANGTGGVLLQSDNASVNLFGDLSAPVGDVVISTPGGLGTSKLTSAGNITAVGLTLTEGSASPSYTLFTNIASFTAPSLQSNISLVNNRSLTVGAGPVFTSANSLGITTTSGDLTILGAVNSTAAGGTTIALSGQGNVSINGAVTSLNRPITITSNAGAVTATALIDAGRTAVSNVDIFAATGISLGNNVQASNLSAITANGGITATSSSSFDFNVVNAVVNGTGDIFLQSSAGNTGSAGNLVLASNISTASGNISLQSTAASVMVQNTATVNASGGNVSIVTAGPARDIFINGVVITSPTGTLTLAANNLSGGQVFFDTKTGGIVTSTLNFVASNGTSSLLSSTNVSFSDLNIALTGTGNAVNFSRAASVNLLNVTTTSGDINITLTSGNLTGTGNVSAGAANVTLNVTNGSITLASLAGQVRGNVLNVSAANASTLNTNVSTLCASITAANQSLLISEATALAIGAGGVATNSGDVTISLAAGNLTGAGTIAANGGNVTLSTPQGGVSLNTSAGQVSGNVLTLTARTNSAVNTNITALAAAISGANQTLTVNEADGLNITTATTAGGAVAITAGLASAGNIGGNGIVNAAAGGVTLTNNKGGITLNAVNGQIVGNVLLITAQNDVAVNTSVTTLNASISNLTATLTVFETDSLNIANATTTGGAIALTAGQTAAGTINGNGPVNATAAGTIALTNANGGITLNAVNNQIVGNVLTITSQNSVNVNTSVTTLNANVTGAGSNLTVTENDGLKIGTANVVTSGGTVAITVGQSSAGALNGTGFINAAAGNVTLTNTKGAITLNAANGQIVGNVLTISAQNDVAVNTSVTTLNANVSDPAATLTVFEADGLTIANATTTGAAIAITAGQTAAGTINGTGLVNATAAGAVTLTTANGGITLNAVNNQIVGDTLTIRSQNDVFVNTSVATLNANVTGAGSNLTVTENDGLKIGAANVVTSGGTVTITAGQSAAGTLDGTGFINATGVGNVTLTNTRGGVFLSGSNQIVANVLAIKSLDSVNVATTVGAIDITAGLVGGGNATASLTVNEATGLGILNATTAGGAINITSGLFGASQINGTGPINATAAGDVTLSNKNGGITLNAVNNQITGNVLTITARNDVVVNTFVANASANVTNGNLTIREADGLLVGTLQALRGSISVQATGLDMTGGNVASGQNLTLAGGQKVTLDVGTGTITGVGNLSTYNLAWTAANQPSDAAWVYTGLTANVTVAGNSINVTTAKSLDVYGLTTNSGAIDLTLKGNPADLSILGPVTAGGPANVTLNVANGSISSLLGGLVTGNVLNVSSSGTATLDTDVTSLVANVSGSGSNLTVSERNSLAILAGTSVVANNAITLTVGTAGPGDLDISGKITSLLPANVTLNVPNGVITGAGNLTANNVAWTAQSQPNDANWKYNGLTGNVTGNGGIALTLVRDLIIYGLTTQNGAINIAPNLTFNGNIDIRGDVIAGINLPGYNAVSMAANGWVRSNSGLVVGSSLTLDVANTSTVSTNVASLTANVSGVGHSLTVNEANGLSVTSIANPSGDVVLNATGDIVSTGAINAVLLNVTANSAVLNTAVTSLTATIAGAAGAGLNVSQTGSLTIAGAGATTLGSPITLNVTGGSLSGAGVVNAGAGSGSVTLIGATGGVTLNSVNNQITANLLTITAQNAVNVNTSVTSINAAVSDSAATLTVTEADGLNIAALTSTGGQITVTAGQQGAGSITGSGLVNATSSGNVTLTNTKGGVTLNAVDNQITANLLTITAQNAVNVNTSITTISAAVSDSAATLTVTEADGLNIAALTSTGGQITITAGQSAVGSITGSGLVNATSSGNVTLTDTKGGVTLNAVNNQITANLLTITAQNAVNVSTSITTINAAVSDSAATLTVTEADGLNIAALTSTGGQITVTAGQSGAGSITGSGLVNATGAGNVTLLDTKGGVTLNAFNNQITANLLTITAQNSVNVSTSVATINAAVSDSAATLTVTEADGLNIAALTSTGGQITITAGQSAAGSITGSGLVNATTSGNVTLTDTKGGVTLNAVNNQITANLLTITAQNSVNVNTSIATINAAVSDSAATLTVTEADGLDIAALTSTGGQITITAGQQGAGSITGSGLVNATSAGNVTLTDTKGGVTLNAVNNQITANLLTITAQNSVNVNTSVATINAAVSDSAATLTVTEADGLNIAALTSTGGQITITAGQSAAGSITGSGLVNATSSGNVTLTDTKGGVTLNAVNNQITGNLLTITAQNAVNVNTSVTTISAAVSDSAAMLTVTEADGLNIAALTSTGGQITITAGQSATGSITGSGPVNATSSGNVALTNIKGGVTLNSVNNQITANLLTITAQNTVNVNTSVTTISAAVSDSAATLTVTEADGLNIAALTSTGGQITITAGQSGAGSITGSGLVNATTSGNVTLIDTKGGVTLNAVNNQITANLLTITTQNSVNVNTSVVSVNAAVGLAGAGDPAATLTVTEADGLNIAALTSTGGQITITAGQSAAGSITGSGLVNATTSGNVTLIDTKGGVTLNVVNNQITANLLTITAQNAVNVNTSVVSVNAAVGLAGAGDPAATLTVTEADGLNIAALTSTGGQITITAGQSAAGSITGSGLINATSSGNVTLTDTKGGVTLNSVNNQTTANLLTITAQNSVNVNTSVATINAAVSDSAATLTVTESDGLNIAGLTSIGGQITITAGQSGAGSITGSGLVNATGSGNVTLTDTKGGVTLNAVNNQITANLLTITAQNSVNVSTSITTINAAVSDSAATLTVTEADGLNVAALTSTGGQITITAGQSAAGSITGSGLVNATTSGNVTLIDTKGGVTLNAVNNQITANLLTITAQNAVNVNTSVATINAAVSDATATLTVTEADGLGIAGVTSTGGQITITAGQQGAGSITGSGLVNATTSGNVTLIDTKGGVTLNAVNNQITANLLTITAQNSVNVNTSVTTINAAVSDSAATLTVTEANGLNIAALTSTGGQITITAGQQGAGSITGSGPVNATSSGNVTLTNTKGGVTLNAVNNQITANLLTITAQNPVNVNTSVTSINAAVSDSAATLTVTEADGLDIAALTSTGGQITITAGQQGAGSITGSGLVSATSLGNVTLIDTKGGVTLNAVNNQITANLLTITAQNSVNVNTSVASINAAVSDATATLTVTEADGLNIAALTSTGGQITITAGQSGAGSIAGSGLVNATTSGNVTLIDTKGGVTLNAVNNQITANLLTITAQNAVNVNTSITTINAAVSDSAATLTVAEADGLNIAALTSTGAQITITAGQSGAGSITGSGLVNATSSGNVTLTDSKGGVTLNAVNNQITANLLTIAAQNAVNVNTSVATINAAVNDSAATLTVIEADGLAIAGATSAGGQISITAGQSAAGSITGSGVVNATSSGNVTLIDTRGGITLSSVANQINANLLTITAQNSVSVNTSIATVTANVTGTGCLAIRDADGLGLATLRTANGAIGVIATSLNIAGGTVDAGASNVILNVGNGVIAGVGNVSGRNLSWTAGSQPSDAAWSYSGLAANVTGVGNDIAISRPFATLDIFGITSAGGNISVVLDGPTGNLALLGPVTAAAPGNILLSTANGTVTGAGVVSGSQLTLLTNQAVTLTTNVSTLGVNVTGFGEAASINQARGLAISSNGIRTNSGLVTITSTQGSINGSGVIDAGSANVVLATPAGAVCLAATPSQIVGNELALTALNTSTVNTSVTSLNAVISGTGSLTVNEADNLAITQARTANGAVNLTTPVNSTVNISSINAALGTRGNLTVVNGNLYLAAPGIRATQTVDLRQAQSVTILSGSINAPVILLPTAQPSVNYLVTSSADSGPGTLRDLIAQINAGGGSTNSTILITANTAVTLNSPLPPITAQVNINGNNLLTLDGTNLGGTGYGLQVTSTSATRSTFSGITFSNFGGPGIDLVGARNISVTGVTVTDSGIGFRATGNLAGSGVFNSTFTNDVVGGVLSNAQNFLVGVNPVGSVLQGNSFNGGTGFRGTSTTGLAISATRAGTCRGTVVMANTFTGYRTGISLAAATFVRIGGTAVAERNLISNASFAGVYASGFCTGSRVIKTGFPTGVAATRRYVVSASRNLTIVR